MTELQIAGIDLASARGQRGAALLRQIGGADFDGPVKRLAAASADMARVTIEFPYGEILSRPGLDLRRRQICTVSVLIAQGSSQPQLKFHMDGLLNVGGSPEDLVEIAILATAILGFPAALDALGVIRQTLADRDQSFAPAAARDDDGTNRYRRGIDALQALIQADPTPCLDRLAEHAPALARWTVEFVFGDVIARDGLEATARQFAIVSMLATVGNRAEALRLHLAGALHAGASEAEVTEVLMQLAVYAGFPAALNAFAVARELFEAPREAATALVPSTEPLLSESRAVRHQRGLAALAAATGDAGAAILKKFEHISPEIGQMIVEHRYGDVYHHGALDPKTRELTSCAGLAARGTKATEAPLRTHIGAALKAGATPSEIVDVFVNLLPHSGYPAVQEALRIAGEVFSGR